MDLLHHFEQTIEMIPESVVFYYSIIFNELWNILLQ